MHQCFWSYSAFWLLNYIGLFRINLEAEAIGMDASHMGAHHGQGMSMLNDTKVWLQQLQGRGGGKGMSMLNDTEVWLQQK